MLKHLLLVVVLGSCAAPHGQPQPPPSQTPEPEPEAVRWQHQAQRVTIVRDDWGIAHVHGHSDGDAVFGMIYAQAEDDFPRVETNYLNALGRLAEAEGESALWQDLRMRLFVDPAQLQQQYAASPPWLRALMDGWADGLNYFLATHPQVKPRVLTRFEPWMALSFTEGSIGGDIERIDLQQLAGLYGDGHGPVAFAPPHVDPRDELLAEPTGSNGIAIAPANTVDHHALLLINPHTSFFFRSELQVSSDDGLHAYGAVTWGQLFVYQGFNDRIGWMHTSTGADAVDEYAETVEHQGDQVMYRYAGALKPLTKRVIHLMYKTAGGQVGKDITVYASQHGPIVRKADDKWIAIRLMQKPIEALEQSFARTKARDLASYRKIMELHANSSNNTVYADADGHIAYFHPQFVPRRDDRFDWTKPVDGSDPATEWNGVHGVDDSPHAIDPPVGWIANTNNWPYSVAGPDSPRRDQFPRYMDSHGENPRGEHATRVLTGRHDFTLTGLRDAAFDSYLPAFDHLLPPMIHEFRTHGFRDRETRKRLEPAIDLLEHWDRRWAADSVATALAVVWGQIMLHDNVEAARALGVTPYDFLVAHPLPDLELAALERAMLQLTDMSSHAWMETHWGDINRYQRLTGELVQPFDDAAPSLPVPFTSSQWGSLASFGARPYPATKKMYGTSGNSFVAVVEFGPRLHAMAVTAGGESGHAESRHFNDEAERYARGELREVYFYPEQLTGHTERTYHPGS